MHRSLRIAKQFARDFPLFPIKLRSPFLSSPHLCLSTFSGFFNEPTTFASKSFSGLLPRDETHGEIHSPFAKSSRIFSSDSVGTRTK